jgi:hypothetical protein
MTDPPSRYVTQGSGKSLGRIPGVAQGSAATGTPLHVTLSATGTFEHARIYPIQFTGHGQPVPGGGAISFVSQLSAQGFGASAARILPSGIIKAP